MEELVLTIAKALVENPDGVSATLVDGAEGEVIELRVADGDMGRVIGKQGRIAKAIRTVVSAAASRQNKRVGVEIVQ